MPGLRLGFLIIPPKIHQKILEAKHTSDISTSGLNQRVFDLYLRNGMWKKHIKYMEHIYRERFEVMKSCLEKYFSMLQLNYSIPQGGLHFWFELPDGYDATKLYSEAAKNNILILPGNIFFPLAKGNRFFRLSIAAVKSKDIEIGIEKLAEVIEKIIGKDLKKEQKFDAYTPLL